jgi:PAS domain-containing protein
MPHPMQPPRHPAGNALPAVSAVPPGTMSDLVRRADWAATPLGPADEWPPSLRTAVGICLASRFPMMIWWGPALTYIYNDAYAPILGRRHPDALGKSGRDVWADVWPTVGPQVEAVFTRGEATWNDRVRLVVERNGFPEDAYFTWSYSPIPDDRGGVGGLLNTCIEETARVRAEADRDRLVASLAAERARLADAFRQSPAFTAVLEGPGHVFSMANDRYYELVGGRDVLGKPVREALPEVAGQGFFELLDRVYASGEPFVGRDVRVRVARQPGRPPEDRYVEFVYQPTRGPDGAVTGVFVHGVD